MFGGFMGTVRATVVFDELVVAKVRQDFGGNLSKGVNTLLHKHLFEERRGKSMFGALKGRVSVKDLDELEREDEKAEREHDELYRRH